MKNYNIYRTMKDNMCNTMNLLKIFMRIYPLTFEANQNKNVLSHYYGQHLFYPNYHTINSILLNIKLKWNIALN